jgi:iron complex outermembrane receptor protein
MNVQKVNAAITALGVQQLGDANFSDLQSLTYNMPNVQLDGVGTTPGYQNFSFRGLGINSSIVTVEPTVGVFVDGVYQGVNAGQVFDNFDLEGIECCAGRKACCLAAT